MRGNSWCFLHRTATTGQASVMLMACFASSCYAEKLHFRLKHWIGLDLSGGQWITAQHPKLASGEQDPKAVPASRPEGQVFCNMNFLTGGLTSLFFLKKQFGFDKLIKNSSLRWLSGNTSVEIYRELFKNSLCLSIPQMFAPLSERRSF